MSKLYQNVYIYQILYKSCSIKQPSSTIMQPIENDYIPQEPEYLRFAPVIIFNFNLAFLIYIIDNIITYSLYRSYYVTRTSTNGSAVYWSRDTHNDTALWRNTRLYRLYIRFGIILTQFYINFSRQKHQIDVLYLSFKTWDSQVSAYTPFHFSFTVPLNSNFQIYCCRV